MTVLALHGFRQNGKIMKDKLKRLGIDAICPDGPLVVDKENNLLGWWKLEVPAGEKVKSYITKPHKYEGFEDTVTFLKATVALNDVTIIIGFSQGAVLATLLLNHHLLPHVQKVLILSGSPIMDKELIRTGKISVPMLSLVGVRDEITDQRLALELSQLYVSSQLGTHNSGHVIPSDSSTKETIKLFLEGK